MRLSFRQGIVQHQRDTLDTPTFLSVNGGFVSVEATNEPTVITFAHGNKDYLYTEHQSQFGAWGPFTSGDHWLFWQLNMVTGVREFGSTNLEPIVGANTPTHPGTGQMWFNTMSNIMYEYNGSSWVEVVRVFACKLQSSVTPVSVSINSPDFRGTQVGLEVPSKAGDLVFDDQGKPVKTSDRKFFTTEDEIFTGAATGSKLKVGNILIPGIAQQALHRHQVVEFVNFNELLPASPFTYMSKIYGIIEEDAPAGDVVNFVTEGIVHDELWDWVSLGAEVNDPVFIDDTGEIQIVPYIGGQLPVGIVVGTHEILFSPRTFANSSANITSFDIFTDLLDTPNGYTGANNQVVRVNSLENGLEFATITSGGGGANTFPELTDTPATYAGANDLFVKVNAGATGLEFTTLPASSIPPSTQECQYLVANDAGGWNEQPPLEAPKSYDIDCFIEGESPSTITRVMQLAAPREFIISDYGHQASYYSVTSPTTDTTYNIRVASSTQAGAIIGTITFPGGGRPIIECTEHTVKPGNRVYLESPNSPDPDLKDVSITIRGYEMPVTCAGATPPTVNFGMSSYTNKTSFTAGDIVMTGPIMFVEWAITEYSDSLTGSPTPWEPYDSGYSVFGSLISGVNMTFADGLFELDHYSDVKKTIPSDLPFNMGGSTGAYFRVKLTVYGPTGKDSDEVIMNWT